MPPWYSHDLLLLGYGILGALAFFIYTTITGTAGYCLLASIGLLFAHQWQAACIRVIYSLTVAAGLAVLVIKLIAATPGLGDRVGLAFLPLPYILGFFGWFFVPGEGE